MKFTHLQIKIIAVVLIAILLGIGIMTIVNLDNKTLKSEITVEIPKGSGAKKIAKILKENKIIKSSIAFVNCVKKNNASENLKPGTYNFGPGKVTFKDILDKLLKGALQEKSITVTIPEGYTVKEIGKLLEEKGLTTQESFLAYIENMELPYEYLEKGKDYRQLEGFLFPDTYSISTTWGNEKIVALLLKQFDKVWTDNYQKQADKLGKSVKEIVTIASLIEREAKVDSERKTISSVIYNRLEKKMLLQIDATVQYLLPEQKERLLYKDLEVDSPYNTYKYAGLPPTPIAAPGKSCIEAALYPDKTEFFYYRAKAVGNGEHYFTKTFDEHLSYAGK